MFSKLHRPQLLANCNQTGTYVGTPAINHNSGSSEMEHRADTGGLAPEPSVDVGAAGTLKQIPEEEWQKQREKFKDTACHRAVKGLPCAYHDE